MCKFLGVKMRKDILFLRILTYDLVIWAAFCNFVVGKEKNLSEEI